MSCLQVNVERGDLVILTYFNLQMLERKPSRPCLEVLESFQLQLKVALAGAEGEEEELLEE